MHNKTNLLPNTMIIASILTAACLTACSTPSDDDGDDDVTVDAGMMTDGSNPQTDGSNAGVCNAEYTPYHGQIWLCDGDFQPTDCTLQIVVEDGHCITHCIETCDTMPSVQDLQAGHFACRTVVSGKNQECRR